MCVPYISLLAEVCVHSTGNEPSAGRAVAHGVMDVLTLGLWEVVGTPVEAVAGQDQEHAIVVVYNNQGVVVGVNEPGSLRREDEPPDLDDLPKQ